MSSRPAQAIRFKGRSYFSLTISPDAPLADWMERLDGWLERSPGFFSRNAVILDVRDIEIDRDAFRRLLVDLRERGIRILGVDGGDESWGGDDTPPFIPSGRDVKTPESPAEPAASQADAPAPAGEPEPSWRPPLVIDAPVRSGQSVVHPEGDVVIIGSVASGAEVVAAGCIHIYGALRGRAMAGAYGDESARIFCRSLEAELLAINGLYRTADEIDPALRKKPARVWLADNLMQIAKFD